MAKRHIFRKALACIMLSSALAISACSSDTTQGTSDTSAKSTSAETKTVTDIAGNTVKVPTNPKSVVVTDNRSFQILQKWGIKLSAAPKKIMNKDLHGDYIKDKSIIDLGNHREPNMEGFVEAKPDLVINGQRFSKKADDIKALIPKGTAFVDINMPEGANISDYFTKQVTLLGDIFDKQQEAKKLISDYNDAAKRAKSAYNSKWTVMGLVVSGGEINYAAPREGRAVGPLFPILGLTPALEKEGTSDHQGDVVSVEAIADSNPDWMLVLDRDQSVAADDPSYSPSIEVIKKNQALKNVKAVTQNHIITAPNGFYVSEDILLYTEFLNDIADAFESAGR
ncbi:siderophore ABC transporter substrate-binding protein [Cutibacterium sp.]|uniref:siderophore ABC transporter substrate-binding protein n=1 Tax=Cutibacterium sp. TaxID=1912221 RepID=UPI0026DD12AA|nr:ABC transporter substrate-binding protein [Cutibacterium sp.]MDO4412413.1 ABC transporter substrate-binding protein [Cutibacterium sp.]